jgi:hypothetical protein
MPEDIQVTISQDSIQKIIETKVNAAVIAALTPNSDLFIEKMVSAALNAKSQDDKYRYDSSDKKPTVLGHMVITAIQDEAKKAIQQWLEEHREKLKAKMHAALRVDKKLAAKLVDTFIAELVSAQSYSFVCNVGPRHRG